MRIFVNDLAQLQIEFPGDRPPNAADLRTFETTFHEEFSANSFRDMLFDVQNLRVPSLFLMMRFGKVMMRISPKLIGRRTLIRGASPKVKRYLSWFFATIYKPQTTIVWEDS